MKKILFVLAVLICFHALAKDKIKVVYFNYPPHVIVEAGKKPYGPTIDVWEKQIAPAADLEIEWVGPIPFTRAMDILEKGEADAISFIAKNAEREKKFFFPKSNHIEGKQGLVVLASAKEDAITSADQLKDKIIGKLGSGYVPKFFEDNKSIFKFEELNDDNSAELNTKKILAGRIYGGYFVFADSLMYWGAKMKESAKLKVIAFPGSEKNMLAYPAMSMKLKEETRTKIESAVEKTSKNYDYMKMTSDFLSAQ